MHDNVYSFGSTGGDSSVEDGGEMQQVLDLQCYTVIYTSFWLLNLMMPKSYHFEGMWTQKDAFIAKYNTEQQLSLCVNQWIVVIPLAISHFLVLTYPKYLMLLLTTWTVFFFFSNI